MASMKCEVHDHDGLDEETSVYVDDHLITTSSRPII